MHRFRQILAALVLLAVLGAGGTAHAQFIKSQEMLLQNAAVATGGGAQLNVESYNSVAVEVTIATTATVTFEVSEHGAVWTPIACQAVGATTEAWVTTATATGLFQCNVAGMVAFRSEITAWTSGAVTVWGRATTAVVTR